MLSPLLEESWLLIPCSGFLKDVDVLAFGLEELLKLLEGIAVHCGLQNGTWVGINPRLVWHPNLTNGLLNLFSPSGGPTRVHF